MDKKILVGLLLLGALFIFGLATFYIENWQIYFSDGYALTAKFPHAQGLVEGDDVRMAGVSVGRVSKLDVDPQEDTEQPVTVHLWIRKDTTVHAQDVAAIETRSVFGGAFLSITPGPIDAPELSDGDTIATTKVHPNITQLLGKAGDALDNASAAFTDLHTAARNVRDVTDLLAQGEGTFGKLLHDTEAYDELHATMKSARAAFDDITEFTTQLRDGKGVLSRLVSDEELADEIKSLATDARAAAASLRNISAELEEGKGTLGSILKDDSLYEELKATVIDARAGFAGLADLTSKASEGDGVLAKLLTDKELGDDIEQIAKDTRAFTAALSRASENFEASTMGRLMSSDEAYQTAMSLLENLDTAAKAFTQEEGTLGLLMTDDTLYKELKGAAESVQRLLDDYREQSPVLTFAGAVFAAF